MAVHGLMCRVRATPRVSRNRSSRTRHSPESTAVSTPNAIIKPILRSSLGSARSPRRRRGHVFVSAQRRSTDEPCMPSSSHAARLLSPQDAHGIRLVTPRSPRRRRRHVFASAQRRSTDEPCMPSSAHAARLLSPRDAYAVCLPAPQSASNTSTPLIYA